MLLSFPPEILEEVLDNLVPCTPSLESIDPGYGRIGESELHIQNTSFLLPPEDRLVREYVDLRNLSLCCRYLNRLATPYLYRCVVLNNRFSLVFLVRSLLENPYLASSVRQLVLTTSFLENDASTFYRHYKRISPPGQLSHLPQQSLDLLASTGHILTAPATSSSLDTLPLLQTCCSIDDARMWHLYCLLCTAIDHLDTLLLPVPLLFILQWCQFSSTGPDGSVFHQDTRTLPMLTIRTLRLRHVEYTAHRLPRRYHVEFSAMPQLRTVQLSMMTAWRQLFKTGDQSATVKELDVCHVIYKPGMYVDLGTIFPNVKILRIKMHGDYIRRMARPRDADEINADYRLDHLLDKWTELTRLDLSFAPGWRGLLYGRRLDDVPQCGTTLTSLRKLTRLEHLSIDTMSLWGTRSRCNSVSLSDLLPQSLVRLELAELWYCEPSDLQYYHTYAPQLRMEMRPILYHHLRYTALERALIDLAKACPVSMPNLRQVTFRGHWAELYASPALLRDFCTFLGNVEMAFDEVGVQFTARDRCEDPGNGHWKQLVQENPLFDFYML
ncbi:hypothetical protein F4778DRAFT_91045 [Xylariomycetidae sp. FL2044]|nr:hypothetical protein F4778DRAFT_91045 [Xylariomycetidae sp. FL2044]